MSNHRRLAGSSLRVAAKAPARASFTRVRSTTVKAEGIVDDVMADFKRAIAENKEKLERAKIVASPPACPRPPGSPCSSPASLVSSRTRKG